MGYFPRTEREKLIEVFACTLFVAARRPRVALAFLAALALPEEFLLELIFLDAVALLELDVLLALGLRREVISNSLT
jgi:hypothetical protein